MYSHFILLKFVLFYFKTDFHAFNVNLLSYSIDLCLLAELVWVQKIFFNKHQCRLSPSISLSLTLLVRRFKTKRGLFSLQE